MKQSDQSPARVRESPRPGARHQASAGLTWTRLTRPGPPVSAGIN